MRSSGEQGAQGTLPAHMLTPPAHNAPQNSPGNHAALSLLGYCYYYTGQFELASHMCVHAWARMLACLPACLHACMHQEARYPSQCGRR